MKVRDIRKMAASMPKTINEAMEFDGQDFGYNDEMDTEKVEQVPQEAAPQQEGKMDVMAFVDDIRKKSLKGMAELADRPDDPLYEILKRIWQTCDKAYNDQRQPAGNPTVQGPGLA